MHRSMVCALTVAVATLKSQVLGICLLGNMPPSARQARLVERGCCGFSRESCMYKALSVDVDHVFRGISQFQIHFAFVGIESLVSASPSLRPRPSRCNR